MSDFSLTLPSNDGSAKYFTGNSNHSWKNQLNKRLDLEGEWNVDMSSISLPPESILTPFLKGLSDKSVIMKSYRHVNEGDTGHEDIEMTVSYGDIKDTRMTTLYDFLKILFEREYELFLDKLTQKHSLVHKPGKEQLLFDVLYNEEEGAITVTSEKVDDSLYPSRQRFRRSCQFTLRKDVWTFWMGGSFSIQESRYIQKWS